MEARTVTVFLLLTKAILASQACEISYYKIGCYHDSLYPRTFPNLLLNARYSGATNNPGYTIAWDIQNYQQFLPRFICDCAKAATSSGTNFFGIQYYAECWSGVAGPEDFVKSGLSQSCVNSTFGLCQENAEHCSGTQLTNFIYYIPEKTETTTRKVLTTSVTTKPPSTTPLPTKPQTITGLPPTTTELPPTTTELPLTTTGPQTTKSPPRTEAPPTTTEPQTSTTRFPTTTTKPVKTNPPTTTKLPTTKPPATKPPTSTETPTTKSTTTKPPTTTKPTTKQPPTSTEPQKTKIPTTKAPTTTTKAPTIITTEDMTKPDCMKKADILIALDISTSIPLAEFKQRKQLLADFVERFPVNENDVHFALLHYNHFVNTDFTFEDPHFYNIGAVQETILQVPLLGGATLTQDALDKASQIFSMPEYGARSTSKKILIIVTDGYTYGGDEELELPSLKLQLYGVNIVAVGFGRKTNLSGLRMISNNVLTMDNMLLKTGDELLKYINMLIHAVCQSPSKAM